MVFEVTIRQLHASTAMGHAKYGLAYNKLLSLVVSEKKRIVQKRKGS
jgi:hypothetical protein